MNASAIHNTKYSGIAAQLSCPFEEKKNPKYFRMNPQILPGDLPSRTAAAC